MFKIEGILKMFKNGPYHNSFSPRKQLMLQLYSCKHSKMTDKTTGKENRAKSRERMELQESALNGVWK